MAWSNCPGEHILLQREVYYKSHNDPDYAVDPADVSRLLREGYTVMRLMAKPDRDRWFSASDNAQHRPAEVRPVALDIIKHINFIALGWLDAAKRREIR